MSYDIFIKGDTNAFEEYLRKSEYFGHEGEGQIMLAQKSLRFWYLADSKMIVTPYLKNHFVVSFMWRVVESAIKEGVKFTAEDPQLGLEAADRQFDFSQASKSAINKYVQVNAGLYKEKRADILSNEQMYPVDFKLMQEIYFDYFYYDIIAQQLNLDAYIARPHFMVNPKTKEKIVVAVWSSLINQVFPSPDKYKIDYIHLARMKWKPEPELLESKFVRWDDLYNFLPKPQEKEYPMFGKALLYSDLQEPKSDWATTLPGVKLLETEALQEMGYTLKDSDQYGGFTIIE